jgi:tetratricopeptide (TPR) repeat protein
VPSANLDIAREINDRKGAGTALGNLGLAYFDLGYYEQAAEYLQQALSIAQETDNPRIEEIILGNLGELIVCWEIMVRQLITSNNV